jgi:hypothetical protein
MILMTVILDSNVNMDSLQPEWETKVSTYVTPIDILFYPYQSNYQCSNYFPVEYYAAWSRKSRVTHIFKSTYNIYDICR